MTRSLGPDPDPTRAFARDWCVALADTSYVSLDPAEIEAMLHHLTVRVVDALRGRAAGVTVGAEVGVALVDAHFTNAGSLGRTIAFLGNEVVPRLGALVSDTVLGDRLEPRLNALLGDVAAGYTRALRDRTLDEQEEILRAGLGARRQAERALRESEARFRAVFEDAAIGIAVLDLRQNRLVSANQAIADMFGTTIAEFCAREVTEAFVHPDDGPDVWPTFHALVRGERDHFRLEKPYLRSDGTTIWTNIVASLIRESDGSPKYLVGMAEDVTERREFHQRLRYQATHDPLTGLPNRTLLFERLDGLLARSGTDTRVGLCYLDLDRFKATNDSLGHDVGDKLLIAVAKRLGRAVRGRGRMVCRLAGDEFVVLVEDPPGPDAMVKLAEEILRSLAEPLRIANMRLTVSASIGVLERAVTGATAVDLIKDADLTLLWAKSEGKGRWALYDADRNDREVAKYQLSTAMPQALDREEFFVEYQPLVRLDDGAWHGAEALVRWRHPRLGRLAPDSFIGLAEETGLIVALGRWVLETSCRQAQRWLQRWGPDAPMVSVNLAVRQLQDPDLLDDVDKILTNTGLPPGQLQLEVTESAVMKPGDTALGVLESLAERGVALSIDDFGTGYSNLAYLRRLPVHNLKLAGSFVDGLRVADDPDPADARIVGTLVTLAQSLDLTVTAEGIETPEQARRLRDLGCDFGQGYLFAKPSPPEELRELRFDDVG